MMFVVILLVLRLIKTVNVNVIDFMNYNAQMSRINLMHGEKMTLAGGNTSK